LLSAVPSAYAQRSVGCFIAGREVDPCHCSRTCASQRPGPSREELERRRREQERKRAEESMHDANDRGVDAFARRDWAAAIEYFRQALRASPGDPDIQHNLRRAQEEQRKERERALPSPRPQPTPAPSPAVAMKADERAAQLSKLSDRLARFESEYKRNPLAHREEIQAALRILATEWLVGGPAASEQIAKELENRLRAELKRAVEACTEAMLADVKRLQPFDWDSPSRAAEKRELVRRTVEEISRLRPPALSEAGNLHATASRGSYQLKFNSGPALRELENVNRTGRWRAADAK
jgi:hypothetical protein